MNNRKKSIVIWSIVTFVSLTILFYIIYIHYTIPNTVRIWSGENEYSLNPLFSVDTAPSVKEVQSDQTPVTRQLQLTYTNQSGTVKLLGFIPIKEINVEVWEHMELIPCGDMIGIDITTDGVMILGTGKIQTTQGEKESPARGRVYTGDLIQSIDGHSVQTIEQVKEYLNALSSKAVTLNVIRKGEPVTVQITPMQDIHKEYRLGIWLRDREQGLGTLTYVNPDNGAYGAVGHGITDVDTREILSVGSGNITTASIVQIIPGANGKPGEIQGAIGKQKIGDIDYNTEHGVYGEIISESILSREAIPIALKNEVEEGDGRILCSLNAKGPKEYDIQIHYNDSLIAGDATFIIEITDKELLETTGGIVQGMSGSPILQNGKLVGAVTHVLVNDPTRGYGIFIENMLDAAG